MSPDESLLVELLGALQSAQLEAIVVGSTAAVLQGAPVMTQDIDLLIRDTPQNRKKVERLCEELDARAVEVSPLSRTLSLIGPGVPIDVLFDSLPGGLTFEALRSRAHRVELGPHQAVVASLEDVIASKVASDRPKDRAQLPILRDTLAVVNAIKKDRPL